MQRPQRLSIAALIATGLVVALLGSECLFRLISPWFCRPVVGPFQPHPVYGWGHIPNARKTVTACDGRRSVFQSQVSINSKGLHDHEYPYERTAGLQRVVVLGDSVTEAMQVKLDENFVKQTEQQLRADGTAIEILNLGIAAFGTDNELLYFREEGIKYKADLVVLAFNIQNDVSENSPVFAPLISGSADGRPSVKATATIREDGGVEFDTTAVQQHSSELRERAHAENAAARSAWIVENLYLVRRLRSLLSQQPPVAHRQNSLHSREIMHALFGVYAEPKDQQWEEAWQLTEALLTQLNRDITASGARLLVMIVPPRSMIEYAGEAVSGHNYPRQRLAKLLNEMSTPFVDLTPAFREHFRETGRTGFLDADVHPNAEGHRVIADALAEALRPNATWR